MKTYRHILGSLVIGILWSTATFSQSPFLSPSQLWIMPTGEFSLRYGFGGWYNPATIAQHPGIELMGRLTSNFQTKQWQQWGLALLAGNTSIAKIQTRYPDGIFSDYMVATAFGNATQALGISYRWSSGSSQARSIYQAITAGLQIRPFSILSIGAAYSRTLHTSNSKGTVEIAFRPLNSPLLTIFSLYSINSNQNIRTGFWQFGIVSEPIDGIRVFGSWDSQDRFAIGTQLSLTNAFGLFATGHLNRPDNEHYVTTGFRIGGYDRNIRQWLFPPKQIYKVSIPKALAYQTPQLFSRATPILSLLRSLEAAADDPSIHGIVLNLTQIRLSPSLAWEFRKVLQQFKRHNKTIAVYFSSASLPELLVIQTADLRIIDPYGGIALPGYLAGRTYYRELLDSLGIGFEELRLFKYKSAVEIFSRTTMSEGEKEQLQTLIDDWYHQTATAISQDRGWNTTHFDSLLNRTFILSATEAQTAGLADTSGRWELLDSLLQNTIPDASFISSYSPNLRHLQRRDIQWSATPRIAVIYAVGVCAMDQGIRARTLVRDLEKALEDNSIAAIVLRVDSPGGDPTAADYIAAKIRDAQKPVIISQGAVAASGGYWLSMYGDKIVATPYTITGSIGVIAGWLYDKGLHKKLRLHGAFVQRGKYSDLQFRYHFPLPLIGFSLPHRNLSTEEKALILEQIQNLYNAFLQNVATGRDTTTSYIHSIAQGRIWSGQRAQSLGLVDTLGSFLDAITIASAMAGIEPDQPIEIVEFPKPPLIDFQRFLSPLPLLGTYHNKPSLFLELLQLYQHHSGHPLLLLPIELATLMYPALPDYLP